jgi:hypothetical protein
MMNAGPTEIWRSVGRCTALVLSFAVLPALSGCERLVPDPPPPAERFEIPAAPPAARGAHAAGIEPPLRLPNPHGIWSDAPEEGTAEEDAESEPAEAGADPGGVTL